MQEFRISHRSYCRKDDLVELVLEFCLLSIREDNWNQYRQLGSFVTSLAGRRGQAEEFPSWSIVKSTDGHREAACRPVSCGFDKINHLQPPSSDLHHSASAARSVAMLPYPFHSIVTPVASAIYSSDFQGGRFSVLPMTLNLTREQLNLLRAPDSQYRVVLYRQQASSSLDSRLPLKTLKFLDFAGCTFKIANSVILKVTSTRDIPINITEHVLSVARCSVAEGGKENPFPDDRFQIKCEFSYAMLFSSCSFAFQCFLVVENPFEWGMSWTSIHRLPESVHPKPSLDASGDDLEDLQTEYYSLSLRCPLSFTRIVFPVRTKTCKHKQCFDLVNYLNLYLKKMKRNCPICQVALTLTDLLMDEAFEQYLKNTPLECDDIFIDRFGQVSTPSSSKRLCLLPSSEQICSNDSIFDQTKTLSTNSADVVVDLTSLSDGADEELLSRFAPPIKKEPVFPVHNPEEHEPATPVAFYIID